MIVKLVLKTLNSSDSTCGFFASVVAIVSVPTFLSILISL